MGVEEAAPFVEVHGPTIFEGDRSVGHLCWNTLLITTMQRNSDVRVKNRQTIREGRVIVLEGPDLIMGVEEPK